MTSSESDQQPPLVSVIIPCYNHGRFLGEALDSIQKQGHPEIEIIVVDDGSTDNTRNTASAYSGVKYIYQNNAGLSAARNSGISLSFGKYLVFLDADDVLFAEAISYNVKYLQENPGCAFVSGWHEKTDEWLYPLPDQDDQIIVQENHYQQLLWGNYIGMHGAVMYQRSVFDEFRFDTSLPACEDYDMYLKIARKYPIGSHGQKLAAYRIHGNNMSRKIQFMLTSVLTVLDKQRRVLKNDAERKACRQGISVWKQYYSNRLCDQWCHQIDKENAWPSFRELRMVGSVIPSRLMDYLARKAWRDLGETLRPWMPEYGLKLLRQVGWHHHDTPAPGKIRSGDFERLTPFSSDFGFDRGGPIDRYYIENFLAQNHQLIRDNVLEIGDNAYTIKFGGNQVLQSDILHINSANTRATYIGDITDVPQIPSAQFDCIIFTQTLHLIYDFTSALRTCYRILKPGGCLLLTVPGISHIDQGEWKAYWLWSFTDTSIKRLMADTFNGSAVDIKTYGNVYVAAAFLYGMGSPEFRNDYLFQHDPSYQVIISAKALKASYV